MELLYETSVRISTAVNTDEVVSAYLEHVAVRGQYACTVVLYAIDEAGEKTAVIMRGFWTPDEGLNILQARFPYTRDNLDPPLDAGQTVTIPNVHEDPRASAALRAIQAESKRPALAMIPLIVEGQRIGLVILSYGETHHWSEEALRPYETTATLLAIGIKTRLQQRLVYEQGQQVAALRERERLARELHDSVTQLIFSVTLIAQTIAPAWQRSPEEGQARVDRLLELSQNALAEMRALLFELRQPEVIEQTEETAVTRTVIPGIILAEKEGVVAALQNHIATVVPDDSLNIELETNAYQSQTAETEIALYRITQEALNNVLKHAQATNVTIKMAQVNKTIQLTIRDDGVGFPQTGQHQTQKAAKPSPLLQGGLGLQTMRERAEALDGSLTITSSPEEGTKIAIMIPTGDDHEAHYSHAHR